MANFLHSSSRIDSNARNRSGQTALEIALRRRITGKSCLSSAGLKVFLRHGCDPNRLTPEASKLLIALVFDYLDTDDDKLIDNTKSNLWEGNLFHFLAKNRKQKESITNYVNVFETFLDEGLDIDALDSAGKTPSCVAAETGNINAMKALLMCGADINLLTTFNSFANALLYLPRRYELHRIVVDHIMKMLCVGLYVSERKLFIFKILTHNDQYKRIPEYRLSIFQEELTRMSQVRLKAYQKTLQEILLEGVTTTITHEKIHALKELIYSKDFYSQFPKLGYLIKGHYRKAQVLMKLKTYAKHSLERLVNLPDCIECIIGHLNENDFKNLICTELLKDEIPNSY